MMMNINLPELPDGQYWDIELNHRGTGRAVLKLMQERQHLVWLFSDRTIATVSLYPDFTEYSVEQAAKSITHQLKETAHNKQQI